MSAHGSDAPMAGLADASPGLLMVMMEPPAALEDEFNDWYDTEHFPQRAALPGFVSASRWVCVDGWPKWLALYELTSPAALRSPAYLAVSGRNGTPWSKRVLPKTTGRRRIVASAIGPHDAPRAGSDAPSFLTLVGWSAGDDAAARRVASVLRDSLAESAAAESFRAFVAPSRGALHAWALIGAASPAKDERARAAATRVLEAERVHLMNRYVPYVRAGSEYSDGA
ncbi:hypothetical protein C7405_105257 [Paraburkholderia caballeronis]|uniref:DUF4286 family protein n=1 Tax=Paraburkholderia caballeronis TaxID=416943 RepID=UPI0010657501|nr:DUF4286 family protein [Paraburkholderia caballeronis]TDV35767.1 hypothetical protein C7405_105257 [Paraburkholderia caballeronis]